MADKPTLTTKTVTENGTYQASSDNADGYSKFTVKVAAGEEDYYYPWTQEEDLPFSFSGVAVEYDGIKLLQGTAMYALDGTVVTTMPVSAGAAVVYNDVLHIFNGTEHYALLNGTVWQSVSTLPYGFSGSSVIVYNNAIHLLGGEGSARNTKHYAWDGESWNEVSTLPYEFGNGGVAVFGGFLHITGSSNSENRKKHYKFNGSSWAEESTITYNFYYGAAVMFDGIHLLGGSGGNTYHYMYKGQFWHIQELIPISFSNRFRAVRYDGKIHLFSGTSHYTARKVTGSRNNQS